jgi:hypothetical protein
MFVLNHSPMEAIYMGTRGNTNRKKTLNKKSPNNLRQGL